MIADLPAGIYTQLEFKIDKVEGDDTDDTGTALVPNDDSLFGHSILLEGSYIPTVGATVPFSCTFDVDAEFQLKAADETATGFEITASGVNDSIIALRLNTWFSGIDPVAFAADPATPQSLRPGPGRIRGSIHPRRLFFAYPRIPDASASAEYALY